LQVQSFVFMLLGDSSVELSRMGTLVNQVQEYCGFANQNRRFINNHSCSECELKSIRFPHHSELGNVLLIFNGENEVLLGMTANKNLNTWSVNQYRST